ncbi:MAG: TIGR01777 family protein [Gammaproteobacteria bacterium]|nr:MAG: TIGR01777 family protein [Gammaproteobacteria bacterium]
MSRVLVTGGTGFVGHALVPALLKAGHALALFTRQPEKVSTLYGTSEALVAGDAMESLVRDFRPEAVINLAGEGIANARWTDTRKHILRESRIGVTEKLTEALFRHRIRPRVMISGSAVGYYGDTGSEQVDEHSPPGRDFAARLCQDWEQAASRVTDLGTRLAFVRIGLVIGHGGLIERMRRPFSLGLGGRLGSGRQWMSWISRADLVQLLITLLEKEDAEGPFNAVAPHPVTNAEFTHAFARALRRPAIFPVPGALLKLVLGELADLLLTGQRVVSCRLESELSFTFQHTQIESAITSALRNDLSPP